MGAGRARCRTGPRRVVGGHPFAHQPTRSTPTREAADAHRPPPPRALRSRPAAERALLCRLAARKFDAGTAERLAVLLAPVGDTDRLAQVGEWIIDCETGERLIARFGNGAGGST